ncbi:MAG: hypothetical protein NTZ79_03750, partial [Proteobacteria bacterium]|nr:hypothetical protein [Pseudomonadota bacterium]
MFAYKRILVNPGLPVESMKRLPELVLMPPPRHALSLALRGRGVRLGGACRGDDSFPCTDEGHP